MFWQLPKFQEEANRREEESLKFKIQGFQYAVDQILHPEFRDLWQFILGESEKEGIDRPDILLSKLSLLFAKIDGIARMINRGFIDKNILFDGYLPEFLKFYQALSEIKNKGIDLSVMEIYYPQGYEFIEEAGTKGEALLREITGKIDWL